jgi:hypothetical protein
MKKTIFLIVLPLLIALGVGMYFYNKSAPDYAKQSPDFTLTTSEILKNIDSDTALLTTMRNKLIQVNEATVKSIQIDSAMSVLELTASNSSSAIIAQIDPRYNESVKSIKANQTINIKGLFTDFVIDTDLGLGNTVQLNYCTIISSK